MFARLIGLPFALAIIVLLYLSWEVHEGYAPYIIPFVLISAILYIFSPQINWWYYSKYPPEIDAPLRRILLDPQVFYQNLVPAEQKRFRNRMAMFIMGNEFMPQSMEDVPEDIKGIIAMNAARLCFGLPKLLLPKFEKFVICPSWFPSPQHPDRFHTSEIFEEDEVILYSAEHLMHSTLQAKQGFNIALYELAKAFVVSYPEFSYRAFGKEMWKEIETIGGKNQEFIEKYINLENLDLHAILAVLFFEHSLAFKNTLPTDYEYFVNLFQQDPLNATNPAIQAAEIIKKVL